MRSLAKWIRSAFIPAARPRPKRARLQVESLEARWVPANLDMTQVAIDHGVHHADPTHLYLNFDGGIGKVSAYNDGAQTDSDIQDILYRLSEIYAPFNVEVTRIYGSGNYYQGNDGSTTIFVGPDGANMKSGVKFAYDHTSGDNTDHPGGYYPSNHQPDSMGHHIAFVDPFGPGNTLKQSMVQIARGAAHEAGHTFGLAHVRTDKLRSNPGASFLSDPAGLPTVNADGTPKSDNQGTVADIMSYTDANVFFANQTLPITTWNNQGTQTVLDSDEQPRWVSSSLWTPFGDIRLSSDPITTQNSFTYLSTVLGARPDDGMAHVADRDAIDPSIRFRLDPHTNLGMNAPVSGSITRDGDYNVYMIQPAQDGTLHLYYTADKGFSPVVMVHDNSDNLVTPTGAGANGFDVSVKAGQLYFVVVGGHDGQGTGKYWLNVESLSAKGGSVSIPETVSGGTVTLGTNALGGVRAVVNGTVSDFLPGEVRNITVTTSGGPHTINVQATPINGAVTISDGAGSRDTVTVGQSGSLFGVPGTVNVQSDAAAKTALVVDDSAGSDNTSTDITRSAVKVERTFATWGAHTLNYSGPVTSLKVLGSTGNDNFQVESTAAGTPLTLVTGTGTNSVFVGADGMSSRAEQDYTAGWTALQRAHNLVIRHTLTDIAGPVNVQANASGKTSLTVDDSGEIRSVSVGSSGVTFSGVPTISYSGIRDLTLVAGPENPWGYVASIPSGVPVTLYNDLRSRLWGPAASQVKVIGGLPSWDGNYQLPLHAYVPTYINWNLPTPDPYVVYNPGVQESLVTRTGVLQNYVAQTVVKQNYAAQAVVAPRFATQTAVRSSSALAVGLYQFTVAR